MIRKKSEHREGGLLHDMHEISLHQLKIERIEVLDRVCPKLRILYLQNNVIGKIERVKRLKDLIYLNLALNNITKIEGLSLCEKLEKLDFTVNFIDLDTFHKSIRNLQANEHLNELYLTGNPCTQFEGYRSFVIGMLPGVTRLDGKDVTKTERIIAKQELEEITAKLEVEAERVRAEKGVSKEQCEADDEEESDEDDDPDKVEKWTPELRLKMAKQEERQEREKEEMKKDGGKFNKQTDYWQESIDKLNEKQYEVDGKIPSQRNPARYEVSLSQEKGNFVCTIGVPKFMDTSLIDVDIHPRWLQCIIKDKNVLLHLDQDVNPDKATVKRHPDGSLILTMPIHDYKPTPSELAAAEAEKAANATLYKGGAAAAPRKNVVDSNHGFRHIVKKKDPSKAELREISVKRSAALEAKRQEAAAEEAARVQAAELRRQELLRKAYTDAGGDDDDDVPPLI